MDIAKLAKLLSSGEITSEKLTETYIENIEKSKVNYYETICKKQALAQAQRIDRQRKEGKQLGPLAGIPMAVRSEEHTSELQSRGQLVCRLLLEKNKIMSRCNII